MIEWKQTKQIDRERESIDFEFLFKKFYSINIKKV